MQDDWIYPSDSEAGAADRLDALRRAQDALWLKLRSEEDPEQRMSLLSAFSENRAAIDELTESMASGDEADRPVDDELAEHRNGDATALASYPPPISPRRSSPPTATNGVTSGHLAFDESGDLVESTDGSWPPESSNGDHGHDDDDHSRPGSPSTWLGDHRTWSAGSAAAAVGGGGADRSVDDDGARWSAAAAAVGGGGADRSVDDDGARWSAESAAVGGGGADRSANDDGPRWLSEPASVADDVEPATADDADDDEVTSAARFGWRRDDDDGDGDQDPFGLDASWLSSTTRPVPETPPPPAPRPAPPSHRRLRDASPTDGDPGPRSTDDSTPPGETDTVADPVGHEGAPVRSSSLWDTSGSPYGGDRAPSAPEWSSRADHDQRTSNGRSGPPGVPDRETLAAFPPPSGDRRPQRGDGQRRSSASSTTQISAVTDEGGRDRPLAPTSSPRLLGAVAALVVVIGLGWLVVSRSGDSDEQQATGDGTEAGQAEEVAGPEAEPDLSAITAALADQGFGSVRAELRSGVIFLVGTVPTAADRDAAMTTARSLADGMVVDGSELVAQAAATEAQEPTEPTGRAATLQTELSRITSTTPIIFESGATELTDLHQRILNSVAGILVGYPDQRVTIVGFTDDTGSVDSNERVSSARAENVKAYLVGQGVPEGSLDVEARGENTASGSAALASLERRVEFEVQSGGAVAGPSDADPIRIAIVAPSARNDLAFTQSMVDAVNLVATERGNVEVAVSDNTFVIDDAGAAIRGYAEEGYDLVIAHGSQFGTVVLEIARDHPDVAFAWGTASDTFDLPNVYAYDAAANEGGYVMGVMSTLLSESGVVGVVGPIEVGDAELYVNGFEAGALATKPDGTVLITYTGSFSDLALAAEAAQDHVAAGVDVMTGSAQMVVGAVSVANESGSLWFGTQANQTSLAPDLVVASQVYRWDGVLRLIVDDIDAGVLGGQSYSANLGNGGLVIEFNPDYPLPAEVRQRADETIEAIVNGTLTPPR